MKKYTLKTSGRLKEFKVDYEMHLNAAQLEAVTTEGGPILVIAGAGSGKTRTVTYRVAWLIESGVDPGRILLVTFTNKAAREMLHRVELLVAGEVRQIWGGTFHHIGNLILRRHAHLLGHQNNFTIIDREDSKDLLEVCVTDLKIPTKDQRFPKGEVLLDIISFSINTRKEMEKVIEEKYPFFEFLTPDIKRVAEQYQRRKEELNLMDFDDLLFNWQRLLIEHAKIKKIYSEKFFHILVDEYQDTNKIQADIVDELASYHRNIMVVGDDSQSIYSFRGANFANIMEFPARYPEAKIVKLETNYRSTPEILDFTNDVISHNKRQFPKVLVSVKKPKAKPALIPLKNVSQQAQFVAQRILELREEGYGLDEIAVLYRSHYHSLEIQMELTRRGIPYQVRSGLRFFERAHIKDVTAYLKIMINPLDELSWKRILKLISGVGPATADKIWKYISSGSEPLKSIVSEKVFSLFFRGIPPEWSEFIRTMKSLQPPRLKKNPAEMILIVLEGGYGDYLKTRYPDFAERMEDLNQLSNFAAQYRSVRRFLSELALLGSVESEIVVAGGEKDERVVLSTVHQAKGLEWSQVFIVWLADGRFPSARALESGERVEEERRLLYVATTRAKEELYLCYPIMGGGWRQATIMKPSRFIQELNKTSYEPWIVEDEIPQLLEKIEEDQFD
ncbi:MAG: ATP-dependent helicase [bacterium]